MTSVQIHGIRSHCTGSFSCQAFHADMKSYPILHEQQWLRTGTSHSHTIPLAQPRKNYLHNSFCYSGAVLWNSLPEIVRQAESLRNFKSLLHGYYNIKKGMVFFLFSYVLN